VAIRNIFTEMSSVVARRTTGVHPVIRLESSYFKQSESEMSPMFQTNQNTLRRALITFACTVGLATAPMLAQDTTPATQPQTEQQPQQGGWHGRGGGEHQLEHLTKALNLTPDQVTQIKAIQASSRQQMETLRSDTTTAQPDKRAKMMSIHQTEQTNIRAVLTDEQKSKFDAMQARMQERRAEHQQGEQAPPPPPPPAN
jgi:Spy/CpxP family protein refolding chaperone